MSAHDHSHSHSHDHSHGFGHHHDHTPKIDNINAAFVIGIILNSAFVIIEVVTGLINGSLSLLTDAGHNLSDVAALALALMAFKLTKVGANSKYTYGYKRSTIIVSLLNAFVLIAGIAIVIYEAISRFMHPQAIEGSTIAWVAFIGIGVNALTAYLFTRGDKSKDKDLNVKGAYLHMAVDAIVSFGVVISGIIIHFSHLYWIDSAVSVIIGVVILAGTWSLLKDSLRLSLDGVPKEMNVDNIKTELMKVKGVIDVHHVHVWALSTTENALTAHIVINEASVPEFDKMKHDLRHRLEHLEINHSTFEPEFSTEKCVREVC
jgi:cobalt-zinc-cadmium efflux system protein